MCGIVGLRGDSLVDVGQVEAALDRIQHRGPDGRGVSAADGWTLGHVRLAVIDLGPRADQPMRRGRVTVAYNGECWNHLELRAELEAEGCEFTTTCDTEAVAWALDRWGEDALPRLEGMFSVAWLDGAGTMHLARDRFGEIPMHVGYLPDGRSAFSSELRGLLAVGAHPRSIAWVQPGAVVAWPPGCEPAQRTYRATVVVPDETMTLDRAAVEMRERLSIACTERAMTDVPTACLLSGGIDSSSCGLLLRPHLPDMRFYTAVHDPKALDLRCAREVAEQFGADLVEVPVPSPTADDLARTVEAIEAPFKAQVEIAWACLHLADALHSDGIKVVFTGEGSDELWAAYNSSFHGIRRHPEGWYGYRRDTFVGQHRKNFPRCNKVFAARSIEARLPFLHSDVVDWGLSLPRDAVFEEHRGGARHTRTKEKGHMRVAFDGLLPARVVTRDKSAFQKDARLDEAAAQAVADPQRFYRSEFKHTFGDVRL